MIGTITEKSRRKKWGFIKGNNGVTYTFQYKDIDPTLLAKMKQNDTVIFDEGKSLTNNPKAMNVRRYVATAD